MAERPPRRARTRGRPRSHTPRLLGWLAAAALLLNGWLPILLQGSLQAAAAGGHGHGHHAAAAPGAAPSGKGPECPLFHSAICLCATFAKLLPAPTGPSPARPFATPVRAAPLRHPQAAPTSADGPLRGPGAARLRLSDHLAPSGHAPHGAALTTSVGDQRCFESSPLSRSAARSWSHRTCSRRTSRWSPKQAPSNSSYKAVLRVGHGCEGKPTTDAPGADPRRRDRGQAHAEARLADRYRQGQVRPSLRLLRQRADRRRPGDRLDRGRAAGRLLRRVRVRRAAHRLRARHGARASRPCRNARAGCTAGSRSRPPARTRTSSRSRRRS